MRKNGQKKKDFEMEEKKSREKFLKDFQNDDIIGDDKGVIKIDEDAQEDFTKNIDREKVKKGKSKNGKNNLKN